MGWTFRGSAYCQLIHDVNQQKRLKFARAHRSDNFPDVIFTNECSTSIQFESHRQRCCRKQGEQARNNPGFLYGRISLLAFKYYKPKAHHKLINNFSNIKCSIYTTLSLDLFHEDTLKCLESIGIYLKVVAFLYP